MICATILKVKNGLTACMYRIWNLVKFGAKGGHSPFTTKDSLLHWFGAFYSSITAQHLLLLLFGMVTCLDQKQNITTEMYEKPKKDQQMAQHLLMFCDINFRLYCVVNIYAHINIFMIQFITCAKI